MLVMIDSFEIYMLMFKVRYMGEKSLYFEGKCKFVIKLKKF